MNEKLRNWESSLPKSKKLCVLKVDKFSSNLHDVSTKQQWSVTAKYEVKNICEQLLFLKNNVYKFIYLCH